MSNVGFKGNVGKVRGLAYSDDGKPRFSFSVAEGHSRLNKQTNEWEDTGTTWWNVTAFGKQAEGLADVIAEGQKQRVVVIGRAQTRHWESDKGSGDSLDVIADSVGIIPALPQQNNGGSQGAWSQPAQPASDPWNAPQAPAPGWGAPQQPQQPAQGGWGDQPANPPC